MRYQISKEFNFEAAHRLYKNYSGKCSNNHGHSWKVVVTLEADRLDEKSMVLDFEEMKKLKKWIDENLDHASLIYEEDPFKSYLLENDHKVFVTDENPTSENIGRIIYEKAKEFFDSNPVSVRSVEVMETCTSKALIQE